MAGRILEMQRKKLASSAVGVVTADTSVGKAVSGFGQQMQKTGTEMVEREEKRSAAESKSRVSLADVEFRREMSKLQQNKGLTEDEYNDAQDRLREQHRSRLPEEDRAAFDIAASGTMNRKGEEFYKIKENRKLSTASGNLRASDEVAANEVTDILSFDNSEMDPNTKVIAIAGVIQKQQEAYDAQVDAFGAKEIDEAKRGSKFFIASSAVHDLMESDPEAVAPFLDALQATGAFTPKEEQAFRKQAKDVALSKRREHQWVREETQRSFQNKITNQMDSGRMPTINELDIWLTKGHIDKGFYDSAKRWKESSQNIFQGGSAKDYNSLLRELGDFKSFLSDEEDAEEAAEEDLEHGFLDPEEQDVEGKTGISTSKEFTMLLRYQERVMDAAANGHITQSNATALLKRVTPIVDKGIENQINKMNQIETARFRFNSIGTYPFSDFRSAEAVRQPLNLKAKRLHEQGEELEASLDRAEARGDRSAAAKIRTAIKRNEAEFDRVEEAHDELDTSTELADARARWLQDYLVEANRREAELNRDLTIAESHQLVDDIRNDFNLNSDTEQAKYKRGQIISLSDGVRAKVIGFKPDGRMRLTKDLNAPVAKPTRWVEEQ